MNLRTNIKEKLTKKTGAAAIAVALICISMFFISRQNRPEKTPAFNPALISTRPETSTQGTCEPKYALKTGEAYRFAIERSVMMQETKQSKPEGATRNGKLVLSAVSKKLAETEVHAKWMANVSDGGEIEGVFTLDDQGAVKNWRWPEGTQPTARRLLTDFVETWAVPAPKFRNQAHAQLKRIKADGSEEAYTAALKSVSKGKDHQNTQQCQYELKRDSSQTAKGPMRIDILFSEHRVRFFSEKESAMPSSAQGTDRVALQMGKEKIEIDASYRVQLEAKLKSAITEANLKRFVKTSEAEDASLAWEQAFFPNGVRDWGALKDAFSKFDASDVNARAEWTAELRVALKHNPSLAKEVAEFALAQPGSQSPAYRAALAALAGSGTAESQIAMQTLYRQGDAQAKRQVLHQFSVVDGAVTENSQKFLATAMTNGLKAGNLGVPAGLALGASLSKSYRPEFATQVETVYRQSKDSLGKAAAIEMMGNSGRVEFFSHIKEASQSKDPSVRESAASALRKIQTEGAQASLSQMAEKDSAPQVRVSAIRSLGQQGFNRQIASVLDHCLAQENEISVKSACLGVYQEFATTSPEAKQRFNQLPKELKGGSQ